MKLNLDFIYIKVKEEELGHLNTNAYPLYLHLVYFK